MTVHSYKKGGNKRHHYHHCHYQQQQQGAPFCWSSWATWLSHQFSVVFTSSSSTAGVGSGAKGICDQHSEQRFVMLRHGEHCGEAAGCGGGDGACSTGLVSRTVPAATVAAGDTSSTATTESEHGGSSGGVGGGCGGGSHHPRRLTTTRPPIIRPPIGRNLRRMADKAVHSTKFHVFIVCLVVFNWFIVIVELLINLRIFELNHHQSSSQSEKAEKTTDKQNSNSTSTTSTFSRILHLINVALLGFFFLETSLKCLLIFGCRRFFKHPMEVFDFMLVLLAFSLILAFGGRETSSDSAALLIVLRLWRVSKIISSMIAVVKHEAERKMAKERRNFRAVEREVCKLREYCVQQECELHAYRMLLQQNCISMPRAGPSAVAAVVATSAPPLPCTLNVVAEVNEVHTATTDLSHPVVVVVEQNDNKTGQQNTNDDGSSTLRPTSDKKPTARSSDKKPPPSTGTAAGGRRVNRVSDDSNGGRRKIVAGSSRRRRSKACSSSSGELATVHERESPSSASEREHDDEQQQQEQRRCLVVAAAAAECRHSESDGQ